MKNLGINSFVFCPGFTHSDLAKISEAVGQDVSINVARKDGPSNRAAKRKMDGVGWFK